MNIEISRASMAEWMIRVAELLAPLYDAFQQMLIKQPSIQADETPIQVLNEPERTPQNKSCMWLYRTTGQLGSPVILYDYQTGRDHERPETFFPALAATFSAMGFQPIRH